jgi:hypothetical protein
MCLYKKPNKVPVSLVMCIRPFVRTDRTDLREILYWNFYYCLSRQSAFGQNRIK